MALSAATTLARPFAAAGSVVRLTQQIVFSRGRGWAWLVSRTRFDYKAEVGDPATNSIVGTVVGWIARNFPEAPVRIVVEDDPTADPIGRSASGPGAMLRLLEKPNPWFSGVLQWMATIVDFVSNGNAYWIKVRSGRGRVVELWWVPATLMEPRWDPENPQSFIEFYEYTVDGIRYAIEPRDVVHFRYGLDPLNTRKGLSPLGSLFREIFTDEEAANFTASLLRNLGVPGVILSPANTTAGRPLDADPEGVKRSFMEKFGGDLRGEPLVLTAPTEVKVLSFNPTEMDLKALRRIPEERVSGRLGVPAGVAGLGAGLDRNTFTNYAEANVAAYTQGIMPLQRLIAAELEVQLLVDFGGPAIIEQLDVIFDVSRVAAMAAWVGDLWRRTESAASRGLLTRADFKRAIGYRVTPADDVYVMANNISAVPAGGSFPPAGAPTVTRAPQPQLGPGGVEIIEPVVAGPVRCKACNHLLAELAAPPYRLRCKHCREVTEALAPAAA